MTVYEANRSLTNLTAFAGVWSSVRRWARPAGNAPRIRRGRTRRLTAGGLVVNQFVTVLDPTSGYDLY